MFRIAWVAECNPALSSSGWSIGITCHETLNASLLDLTSIIETYRLLPLSIREHYGQIYECVEQVYKKAGISIES
jgi:hypothetical protein